MGITVCRIVPTTWTDTNTEEEWSVFSPPAWLTVQCSAGVARNPGTGSQADRRAAP